jgi:hypothetical protein
LYVNQDDRHILALVDGLWLLSCLAVFSSRTIGSSLRIKLNALIRLGVNPLSFDTGARNGVLCGSRESHITKEFWPGRGLNPDLPNETWSLYPLLHELAPCNNEVAFWTGILFFRFCKLKSFLSRSFSLSLALSHSHSLFLSLPS